MLIYNKIFDLIKMQQKHNIFVVIMRKAYLTYEEFVSHFGTNPRRMEQIKNALKYFSILYSCGCQFVYIDGSFASTKKNPEDIVMLFDVTGIDMIRLKKEFPQIFDVNQVGKIRRDELCHIFTFTRRRTKFLDMLSVDRENNPKGLVILKLKDIPFYDQK